MAQRTRSYRFECVCHPAVALEQQAVSERQAEYYLRQQGWRKLTNGQWMCRRGVDEAQARLATASNHSHTTKHSQGADR